MADLISRQAAIDDLYGRDPSQIWDTADIEVWINALPFVEPSADCISRQAAIMHFVKAAKKYECGMFDLKDVIHELWKVPSAEPDFSCDGCMTPKHICGICMRNYPNITDHYCTGEA